MCRFSIIFTAKSTGGRVCVVESLAFRASVKGTPEYASNPRSDFVEGADFSTVADDDDTVFSRQCRTRAYAPSPNNVPYTKSSGPILRVRLSTLGEGRDGAPSGDAGIMETKARGPA